MAEALAGFGDGYGGALTSVDFPPEESAVRMLERDCPLDIFNRMTGRTYSDLLSSSLEKSVEGATGIVPYLNGSILRELKKDSFREKDRLDALMLGRLERGLGLE